jgi:hypothetical protein
MLTILTDDDAEKKKPEVNYCVNEREQEGYVKEESYLKSLEWTTKKQNEQIKQSK